MTTVGDWLAGQTHLDRLDREVLVCRATGLTRAALLTRPETPLEPAVACRLDRWAARRRQGEPVAYIIGIREFWGLALEVSTAVLVPRPETELLVETGLEVLETLAADSRRGAQTLKVLELGTGSGAVAIALDQASGDRAVEITATDVSAAALAVAAANGRRHGARVTWVESDWFAAVTGRYDLVVSNPPYVAADDPHLAALAHEPPMALVAGREGLDALHHIIDRAGAFLTPGGALLLEHGWDQGAGVRQALRAAGFQAVATASDLAGLERVSRGYRAEGES